jgi:polyhydroxyalkanoate synthesis regulator phasin
MSDESAEVKVKLVVDDTSAATLDSVKHGFEGVDGEAKKTTADLEKLKEQLQQIHHQTPPSNPFAGLAEEIAKLQPKQHDSSAGIAKEVLKGNIYFGIMKEAVGLVGEGIEQAWHFTEQLVGSSVEAAEAQEKQEKQMANFLSLMDGGKHSMQDMRQYTGELREEFARFGTTAGVATKDLVEGFDHLVARGTMSSEKAKELTEQMAIVGRVVPGGMSALTQGMSGVEMGMVRARNPIVQLIAATHTLEGNAKSVASAMQKMTPEKQMELAEKAIAKQAESMKRMGAVPPDLGQLKASFGNVGESFRESMGQPMMAALIPNLVKLRDFLIKHADEIKAFGQKIGDAAASAIEYVSIAIDGIYAGMTENWESFRDTFEKIYGGWKDAWLNGEQSTTEIKKDFETVGHVLRDVFEDILKYTKAAVEVAMKGNDILHLNPIGTTQAGVASEALEHAARTPESDEAFKNRKDEYSASATAMGADPEKIDAYVNSMNTLHDAFSAAAQDDKSAVMADSWGKVNESIQYNIQNHREGLNEYILATIQGSAAAKKALHDGAADIGNGADALMKLIAEKAPALAKEIANIGKTAISASGGVHAKQPVQIFNGGIHIKQDFKDNDPDRIAIIFRKELSNAAASRTVSRNSPYGSL